MLAQVSISRIKNRSFLLRLNFRHPVRLVHFSKLADWQTYVTVSTENPPHRTPATFTLFILASWLTKPVTSHCMNASNLLFPTRRLKYNLEYTTIQALIVTLILMHEHTLRDEGSKATELLCLIFLSLAVRFPADPLFRAT